MAARESKWSGVFGGGGGGGSGDVVGPASSVDGALSEFNGTTGKTLRESTARIVSDDLSLAGKLVKFNRGGTDASADGSGLDVLGTGDATISQLLFDPLLASRWKAGPAGSLSAVLTAAATQTVTNKTIQDSAFDGGTASSARKIILPKATKAALDALTQEEGLLGYATDEDRLYASDGAAMRKIGTVDGPASVTDNQLVRFDGTTGKLIQSSAIGVNDSGDMDGVNDLNMSGDLTVAGNTVLTGNLEVQGTQTILNTDQLQVEDKSIQVNYGGTNASAEGAGVEAVGTGNAALARMQYDSALTSKWKVGAAGSEKEVATVSDTQTISSKTLNNTNTAAFKDDQLTIEDPADATKKVRFDAGNVSAGQTRVMGVPNADTTLLGADTAQTVTNKDIDGGTASNTLRLTMPKNTYANLSGLTRKEGTIVYATDHDAAYLDDGSSLIQIPKAGRAPSYTGGATISSGNAGEHVYVVPNVESLNLTAAARSGNTGTLTSLSAGVWLIQPLAYVDAYDAGTPLAIYLQLQYYNGTTWVLVGGNSFAPFFNTTEIITGSPEYYNQSVARNIRIRAEVYGTGFDVTYYFGLRATRIYV